MRASPHHVFGARLAPAVRGDGRRIERGELVRNPERVEHPKRDRVVAERVHVQPVVSPVARIFELGEPPLIGDNAVVPGSDRANVLVVDRGFSANALKHGREAHVDRREDDDRRAARGKPRDDALEFRGDLVGVRARAQDIVAARANRDEVGL